MWKRCARALTLSPRVPALGKRGRPNQERLKNGLHPPHGGGGIRPSNNSKINSGNVLSPSRPRATLLRLPEVLRRRNTQMGRPFYAVIIPLGDSPDQGLPRPPRPGRPGHRPDQGLPGGGEYPDQGLPGGEYPDQGLPGEGGSPDHGFNPDYPDQGLPGGGGRPPRPGHLPSRPGRPIDPGFGWGGGERPGHRPPRPERPTDPGYGVGEEHPDQGLPPELGP